MIGIKKQSDLPGTGPGRNHEPLARVRFRNRLCLIPVEHNWLRFHTEYLRGMRMEQALRHEVCDTRVSFVVRIDADKRLGPEFTRCVESVHLGPNILSSNLSEGTCKMLIVANDD